MPPEAEGLAWVRRLRSGHRPRTASRLRQPVAPPLATCRGARRGLDWPWADDGRMTCFHLPLAVRGRAACQDPRVCRGAPRLREAPLPWPRAPLHEPDEVGDDLMTRSPPPGAVQMQRCGIGQRAPRRLQRGASLRLASS